MTKKQSFINYVQSLIETNSTVLMSEYARSYWEAFKLIEDNEKPLFTDNGKIVIQYMKDHPEVEHWKAKDLAEASGTSSRTVSGAMRKLVTDGFVEKIGQDPTIYKITYQGSTIEIN